MEPNTPRFGATNTSTRLKTESPPCPCKGSQHARKHMSVDVEYCALLPQLKTADRAPSPACKEW